MNIGPVNLGKVRNAAGWLVRLIRTNALFSGALAVGAALRLVAVLAYPGVTWFYGDSYVYLATALRPRPNLTKTIGYSFFLRALEPLHSFTLVAIVQHLMGLAMAVMVYVLLRRAGLPKWGATLATLPVLLDAYVIQLEHMVMSETVFTFAIAVAVTLVMWRKRPGPWAMLAAGLLLGYAVTVRTVALPLLAVLVIFLVIRRAGWRPVVTAVAGGVIPIALYAAWFHSWNGQYALTRSDGFFLWGRVSSFAECANISPPASERVLCLSTPVRDRPPPGSIIWRNTPPRHLPGGPVTPANNKLMRDFAMRAIMAQPGGYLLAVTHDVGLAFYWHRLPYPNSTTAKEYQFGQHPQVIPLSRSWIPGATTAQDMRAYGGTTASHVVQPYARALRAYQRRVFTPGPLLGLAMLAGLCGVVRFWRRLGGDVLFPWATAAVLLLFPIATADFSYRYMIPVLPFAFLAAALAFAREQPVSVAPGPVETISPNLVKPVS
ncbi:MAG: phospholipid carrier-dependent glycosyltransferase [Micromonosporaceae bacterium]